MHFFDFISEDFSMVASVAVKILFFGNYADTNHIILQWDVPKPAFFRNIGNGGGTLVGSWIAFCALEVSPYGDFIELRVFCAISLVCM